MLFRSTTDTTDRSDAADSANDPEAVGVLVQDAAADTSTSA